jgi:antitoxin component YwqK of YwqJK toxin-antitoxin module
MIGYKIGLSTLSDQNTTVRVLITLNIPDNAKTNINRTNTIDSKHASYRCNKAIVVSIEDTNGCMYTTAKNFIYKYKTIVYKVNEEVTSEMDISDPECNNESGQGIYFFLCKEVALMCGLDSLENGEYIQWYSNGQLQTRCNFVNGKRDGEYNSWHANGHPWVQCKYINGQYDGEYKYWYPNGQLQIQCNFVNGISHGEYNSWHSSGQQSSKKTYKNGKIIGEYKLWDKNGELYKEFNFKKLMLEKIHMSEHQNSPEEIIINNMIFLTPSVI